MRIRLFDLVDRHRFAGALVATVAALAVVLVSGAIPAPASPAAAHGQIVATPAPLTLAPRALSTPHALAPAEIHSAYGLPARGARGQTIAVVSAYNDPSVQADLNAYRQQYNLPPCTTTNRCLRVLTETGQAKPLPPADPTGGAWITESAVGTEIAHGVCQSCSILLVEANSDTPDDVSQAVQAAIRAGATVVTTSFIVPEDLSTTGYFLDYSSARAAIVAATGDGGDTGTPNFPSVLPDVLGVGGTNLQLGPGGRYGGETAWSGTASGCSRFEPAPLWQVKVARAAGCRSMRPVADLAAMSEPGAAVHITGVSTPGGPWYDASGTSLSAPIIAGVIGLAGSAGSGEAQMLYQRARSEPAAFHDILTGSDSPSCKSVLCQAGPGWDGPTGLGTPYGLAAFLPSGGALDPRHPAVSVTASGRGVRVNGRFIAPLGIANTNPFAVSGTIVLRRTLRINGRLQPIVFASGKLSRDPLGAASETLTIAPRYRALLKRLGSVDAFVSLHVRGPAGGPVTVTKSVLLRAP